MKRVCVYCGSSPGLLLEYAEAARRCGQVLANRRLTVVYGGGNVGLMNALADGALAAGGEVIGVIPRHLVARELAHRGLTSLITVNSMHERKGKMAELADAFIALPGGVGTLEEVLEIFTWLQLGLHRKPVGLLNVSGFYDPLLNTLVQMQAQRFLKPEHFKMLQVAAEIEPLLDRLANFIPSPSSKWIDRGDVA
jgi:uncharacterized protein (TIGR00730 family)